VEILSTYFKIGDKDFSKYVNSLKISENRVYNAQTNAAGNTVVDFINRKRTIEVGFIPMMSDMMLSALLANIEELGVSISFMNPKTAMLEQNVNCIIPSVGIDYYTIINDRGKNKPFTLTFTEL
jgi:hypothetical protein